MFGRAPTNLAPSRHPAPVLAVTLLPAPLVTRVLHRWPGTHAAVRL